MITSFKRAASVALFTGIALLSSGTAVAQQKAEALLEFNYGIPNANHASVFVRRTWACSRRSG